MMLAAAAATLLVGVSAPRAAAQDVRPDVEAPAVAPADATEPATSPSTEPATSPTTEPSTGPATTPATEPTTTPVVTPATGAVDGQPPPIPLAEVAGRVDATIDRVEALADDPAAPALAARLGDELPPLVRDIDARVAETARIVAADPSLEVLRAQERSWESLRGTLAGWRQELTASATQLERHLESLGRLGATWQQTLDAARAAGAPDEVVRRIERVVAAVAATTRTLDARRAQALTLQNRVAEQDARASDALSAVATARGDAINRLFARDAAPIWSRAARARASADDLVAQGEQAVGAQLAGLRAYAARQGGRFLVHLVLFAALVAALRWARPRVAAWAKEEPNLKRTALVFDAPLATAAVLATFAAPWIYAEAPRLFWAVLFALALVPAVVLLRRLVEPRLAPVLYALIAFYFTDQARLVSASQPLLSRALFAAEMAGGVAFVVWFVRTGRLEALLKTKTPRVRRLVELLARAAGGLFAFALVANVVGYASLSTLVGNGTLGGAYVGVVLYALTRIVDGLIMAALRGRPLGRLRMVQRDRTLIWHRARRVVHWVVAALWLLVTLDLFTVRGPVGAWARGALSADYAIGSLRFSPGHLLAFALTIVAAFLLSRFARSLLEADVYPRFNLGRGVPYAVSTILHYAILVAGFLLGAAALGYDMTKFTILAGAFGVGIGFGMQNIVNNFVSGLILLFERPIQVGDVIELDAATVGTVTRIGIRASVIRTANGAAVILPNGLLIANRVTNWTLASRKRRVDLPVAVNLGTDPQRVIDLLVAAASAHGQVEAFPPPEAVIVSFTPGAMNFELRAWTGQHADADWTRLRSDLAIAVNRALTDAGIPLK
jgi:small-conductance mechanosensitive channel